MSYARVDGDEIWTPTMLLLADVWGESCVDWGPDTLLLGHVYTKTQRDYAGTGRAIYRMVPDPSCPHCAKELEVNDG